MRRSSWKPAPSPAYIDVAQVTLYAFWVFFAGLIFYLRREDKREGYPLEADRAGRMKRRRASRPSPGSRPSCTTHGPRIRAERSRRPAESRLRPVGAWPGAPMQPTGNPMLDGVGPAAWADREDVPELTYRRRAGDRAAARHPGDLHRQARIPIRAACR